MAFPGLTPCPGGDCHGIDHAWCAPPRHAGPYDRELDAFNAGRLYWPLHRG